MSFTPLVDKAVFEIAPSFRANSLLVSCGGIRDTRSAEYLLEDACNAVQEGGPEWADDHLESWARVFREFGAKPQRTPCSAAALRKRTLRSGCVPSINPVVDIYNAISLKYAIPVGGENRDAYRSPPSLTIANGNEAFDTVHNGCPTTESPEPGEIIWRDDAGVTCRRWNWRQGVRTQIGPETKKMWFVLECLDPFPLEKLDQATNDLVLALESILIDPILDSKLIGGDK